MDRPKWTALTRQPTPQHARGAGAETSTGGGRRPHIEVICDLIYDHCKKFPLSHQQCDVNYREIRRATLWSYEFHRRIDGRVPPAEGTRPYEKLPIPTDLAIVHITLLVARRRGCGSGVYGRRRGGRALPTGRAESWRRTRKPSTLNPKPSNLSP